MNALDAIGLSVEQAAEAEEDLKKKTGKDRRICVCGHPVIRHKVGDLGILVCKPNAVECPCLKARPVLEADDTRYFLRSTNGSSAFHALARGIAAIGAGNYRWTIEMKCDRCKKMTEDLTPVAVSQRGSRVSGASVHNALVCDECVREI